MTGFSTGSGPLPRLRRSLALVAAAALLSGCITNPLDGGTAATVPQTNAVPSAGTAAQGQDQRTNSFAQFSDIPIPVDAAMDLGQTLVLGDNEGWIGRLSLDVTHGMTDMYAFYEQEMPRFGWERITTVRARISTLTYRRGPRIATVTLQPTLTNGTTVDFTVAPANTSRNVASSG